MTRIYLDFNASTPTAPEVLEAMQPYLKEEFGNPSSAHWSGRRLREAIAAARSQVAQLLGAKPDEIVFTSGGSESNNQVLKGLFHGRSEKRPHYITTTIEHPSILEPCRFLEQSGAEVSYVAVDGLGMVDPEDIRRAIRPKTVLISVMHANSEVGTIQPIGEISRIARQHRVLLHTDAAQSVGKISVDVEALGVDFLSLAGHKLYAPKGVGALFIRQGLQLEPLVHGGGQEDGRRSGTENVPFVVALGRACQLAQDWLDSQRIRSLRDRFWRLLQERFGETVTLNGHPTARLPNTLNVSFVGFEGSGLLAQLDGVAASTGSACHDDRDGISPVLEAIGVSEAVGRGAVRFSLGRGTTDQEIETVVESLDSIC